MTLSSLIPHIAIIERSVVEIAKMGNDRLTVNQAAFFLIAAHAEAAGRPSTLTEIIDCNNEVLNQSLKTTYKVLLVDGGKSYRGKSLGWLEREVDPDDQRKKYLRVTDRGRAVIHRLTAIL